jgi:hypothetical protein
VRDCTLEPVSRFEAKARRAAGLFVDEYVPRDFGFASSLRPAGISSMGEYGSDGGVMRGRTFSFDADMITPYCRYDSILAAESFNTRQAELDLIELLESASLLREQGGSPDSFVTDISALHSSVESELSKSLDTTRFVMGKAELKKRRDYRGVYDSLVVPIYSQVSVDHDSLLKCLRANVLKCFVNFRKQNRMQSYPGTIELKREGPKIMSSEINLRCKNRMEHVLACEPVESRAYLENLPADLEPAAAANPLFSWIIGKVSGVNPVKSPLSVQRLDKPIAYVTYRIITES